MKIYFAGSIRGGRDDKQIYFEVIKKLTEYGQVLTEHIGKLDLLETGEGVMNGLTDLQIYKRDCDWIKEADVLVAEVTQPSLGVGYELGFAEALGKRILCIYRELEGKKVSAMISGNNTLRVEQYKNIEDLKPIFDLFLQE